MHDLPPPQQEKYQQNRFCVDRARIEAARQESTERHALLEACRLYLLKVANQILDSDLRPRIGASDLVQDSIIAADRDFEKFEGDDERALYAWLTKILENRLAENVRKHKLSQKRELGRDIHLDGAPFLDNLFRSDSTPSAYAVAREEEKRVQEALARLNDKYRRVIYLRNWELLTFEEIGSVLGIKGDAACKRWWRAVAKLEKELGKS